METLKQLKTATCFCFDTVNTITADCEQSETLQKAIDLCYQIENLMSRFVEGSDVWHMNHAKGNKVKIHSLTEDILRKSIDFGIQTDGVFDITVGVVSGQWDFVSEVPKIPEYTALHQSLKNVGYKKIDIGHGEVSLESGTEVDLGGIAKGFATDLIAELLRKDHVHSAIINLGGNIGVIGRRPDKMLWRVGIQNPKNKHTIIGAVGMADKFISTSGIYERSFLKGDTRFHHILNVDNGMPVENELLSVSIISENGTEGDALATACMCMGFERALGLLNKYEKTEALFVFKDDTTYWHGNASHLMMI